MRDDGSGWVVTRVSRNGSGSPYWIDCQYVIDAKSPSEAWMTAALKWDGCVHLNRLYNTPKAVQDACPVAESPRVNDSDYLHICSLSEMREHLSELLKIGREHFGNDWDGGDCHA